MNFTTFRHARLTSFPLLYFGNKLENLSHRRRNRLATNWRHSKFFISTVTIILIAALQIRESNRLVLLKNKVLLRIKNKKHRSPKAN